MSERALAHRREQFALPIANTEEETDQNARIIGHIMQIHEIAMQADKGDLLSLRSCFINYLKLCQANGFSVSNLAAYSAMGFTNEGWSVWAKKDDPEIRKFVAFVKGTCAMFREEMVTEGKLNPVIGIFWQRNFDGLRNDTEQIQALNEQEDNERGVAYKEKYRKLLTGGD